MVDSRDTYNLPSWLPSEKLAWLFSEPIRVESNQVFVGENLTIENLGSESRSPSQLFIGQNTPRVGNMIQALKNIRLLGERENRDIDVIFVGRQSEISTESSRVSGVRLLRENADLVRYQKVHLHEDFFKLQDDHLRSSTKLRESSMFARKFFQACKLESNFSEIKSADLCIHIRSGDIFGKNPHPDYWQPPLGFYQAIINFSKAKSIELIFEDSLNPVIPELIAFIKLRGLKLRTSNGRSITEATAAILNAKSVVFGTGTFVPQILSMSTAIECTYSMRGWGGADIETCNDNGVKRFFVDSEFATISRKYGPWVASREQIAALTRYDESHFKVSL